MRLGPLPSGTYTLVRKTVIRAIAIAIVAVIVIVIVRPVRLLRVQVSVFDSSKLLIMRGGNSHVR